MEPIERFPVVPLPGAGEGEFALALFGPSVQGDASNGISINLEDVVVAELFLDSRAGALDQFFGFHRALGEVENAADILLEGAANLLEFVVVDERADTFVGEDLSEQALLDRELPGARVVARRISISRMR